MHYETCACAIAAFPAAFTAASATLFADVRMGVTTADIDGDLDDIYDSNFRINSSSSFSMAATIDGSSEIKDASITDNRWLLNNVKIRFIFFILG
jgi:hypothetical protein